MLGITGLSNVKTLMRIKRSVGVLPATLGGAFEMAMVSEGAGKKGKKLRIGFIIMVRCMTDDGRWWVFTYLF